VDAKVHFFSEETAFTIKNKSKIRQWLNRVIQEEAGKTGTISFIFCSDNYLLSLNKTFLKHNTLTDILTFADQDDAGTISGDIFISIPRVEENSVIFQQSFTRELNRVMVHGVLHLLGYKDKTKVQKMEMTSKENQYLQLL
jgi:probable rRNA maturation factor